MPECMKNKHEVLNKVLVFIDMPRNKVVILHEDPKPVIEPWQGKESGLWRPYIHSFGWTGGPRGS